MLWRAMVCMQEASIQWQTLQSTGWMGMMPGSSCRYRLLSCGGSMKRSIQARSNKGCIEFKGICSHQHSGKGVTLGTEAPCDREGRQYTPVPVPTIRSTIRSGPQTRQAIHPPRQFPHKCKKNRSSTHEARRDLRPPPIDLPLCGLDVISLAPWNSPSEKKSLVRVVTRFGLTRAVGRG